MMMIMIMMTMKMKTIIKMTETVMMQLNML